jgi:hypothetical protein
VKRVLGGEGVLQAVEGTGGKRGVPMEWPEMRKVICPVSLTRKPVRRGAEQKKENRKRKRKKEK